MTPDEHVILAHRTYYEGEIAKLRKALTTDQDEWLEQLQLGIEMRRALKSVCEGQWMCRCDVCRAAWGWDHKYGAITMFMKDDLDTFDNDDDTHPRHFLEESTF